MVGAGCSSATSAVSPAQAEDRQERVRWTPELPPRMPRQHFWQISQEHISASNQGLLKRLSEDVGFD